MDTPPASDVHARIGAGPPWSASRSPAHRSPTPSRLCDRILQERGKGKRAHYILYFKPNIPIAVIEAIAKGQDRILLVMVTGMGKTYTAFQIIWRLWKARRKKRILFLADRDLLVDQAMANDFRPFGGTMTMLSRHIDSSYEVYLGLYQAITGPEERQKAYRRFSPVFFDLIDSPDDDSA